MGIDSYLSTATSLLIYIHISFIFMFSLYSEIPEENLEKEAKLLIFLEQSTSRRPTGRR